MTLKWVGVTVPCRTDWLTRKKSYLERKMILVVSDVWRNGASCCVSINVVCHPEATCINCSQFTP